MSIGARLRHPSVENACPDTGCDRAKSGGAAPIFLQHIEIINQSFFLDYALSCCIMNYDQLKPLAIQRSR
jgi:hypothetical protein